MSHHLVIGKAGGRLGAGSHCSPLPHDYQPGIPGQEEGNARLIQKLGAGVVAEGGKRRELVEEAFAHKGRQWQAWRDNLQKAAQPDSALRIADLIIEQSRPRQQPASPAETLRQFGGGPRPRHRSASPDRPHVLLCDFHIHTNYSDGRLTLPEVIDFYGRRGFDCICVTDHIADPGRLDRQIQRAAQLYDRARPLDEYFDMLERERRRAWRKYEMLVMTGLEFNKEGFTKKTSGHLLALDLKAPISPALGFVESSPKSTARAAPVAAHPHVMKSEWGKTPLFLWENQDVFAPVIDAWEIANRNNIFTPVGLKRFAFLAEQRFSQTQTHLLVENAAALREGPRGD